MKKIIVGIIMFVMLFAFLAGNVSTALSGFNLEVVEYITADPTSEK